MTEVKKDYIIFRVNNLLCALNCEDVQEIIREKKGISKLKRAPEYIQGVINLRGQIVSVINLTILFEFHMVNKKNASYMIVVNHGGECFGLLVSEVLDIVSESEAAIEPPPAIPIGMRKEFLAGAFDVNGKLVTLLNKTEIINKEKAS